jgi:hypothetical protein
LFFVRHDLPHYVARLFRLRHNIHFFQTNSHFSNLSGLFSP